MNGAAAAQSGSDIMQTPPSAPKITYPLGSIDSFLPSVAWMGEAHDAYEVRITNSDDVNATPVWQSAVTESPDSYLKVNRVLPSRALFAFVRIRNSAGWSEWSEAAAFETPSVPVVEMKSPLHASSVKGNDITILWEVTPSESVQQQTVSIDGGTPVSIPPRERSYQATLAEGVHTVRVQVTAQDSDIKVESTFHVYKPMQLSSEHKLRFLDLRHIQQVNVGDPKAASEAFDTLHLAAVLQGVVNRGLPRLYIDYTGVDMFWLQRMQDKGGYLEHVQLEPVNGIDEAVDVFRSYIKGAVVWDPNVPATNNVASTICGCEDLIPVRFDESAGSLYDRLIKNGPRLPVVHSLVGMFTGRDKIPGTDRDSTGSAKCDAYLWAKIHYLDTGKCNPRELGYYCDAFWLQHPGDMSLDNVGLTNHDYIVARKGFICDLNVWSDESPRDDPDQGPGLDREVLMEILQSCHDKAGGKMIHFCGFTPWAIKYTTHGNAGGKHDAVPTEWETAELASAYNCYMDADAIGYVGMANASVFSHSPLPDRLVQNPPPTKDDLRARGYIDADGNVAALNFVYHYLGDYDSAAWIYNRMPEIWRNGIRGNVPSGWAFNPNLSDRIPIAFEWFYSTKTASDYFIAGDSGAGYVNPTQLLPPRKPSGLKSGARAWIEHNKDYYRRFNYSITGFLINGFCGALTEESNRMFLPFSGDGIMTQLHWMPKDAKNDHLLEYMPVAGMKQDITAPIDVVVKAILKHGRPEQTAFLSFRSILINSEWIRTVNEGIRKQRPECRFEPVDPYTYFYLLRHALGGRNEMRTTYTFDDLPSKLKAGQTVKVTAGIRNDGWDTWSASGPDAVVLRTWFGSRDRGTDVVLPTDVEPGDSIVVSFELTAPNETGTHEFGLDLRRGAAGYFSESGDMPWLKSIIVEER